MLIGLFIDKYQRVFRSDGKWMKREKFPLKIPIRNNFSSEYEVVYYRTTEKETDESNIQDISALGEVLLSDQIPQNSQRGSLCEYIGI